MRLRERCRQQKGWLTLVLVERTEAAGDGALVLEEEYVGYHLKRWTPVIKEGRIRMVSLQKSHREGLSGPDSPAL